MGALPAPTSMALACRVEEPSTASLPDIAATFPDVRLTFESRHRLASSSCPLCATTGPSASQRYSVLFEHLIGGCEQGWRDAETERQGDPFSLIFRLDQATITVAVSGAQNRSINSKGLAL
jgi:hypothetical protein